MPDQPVDLPPKALPLEERTEFTPEERVEFEAVMAKIDRQLDELHANSDRRLIQLGLTP